MGGWLGALVVGGLGGGGVGGGWVSQVGDWVGGVLGCGVVRCGECCPSGASREFPNGRSATLLLLRSPRGLFKQKTILRHIDGRHRVPLPTWSHATEKGVRKPAADRSNTCVWLRSGKHDHIQHSWSTQHKLLTTTPMCYESG